MANFLTNIISGLLGKKSDRDLKEILPILTQIKEAYEIIKELSND